MKVISPLLVGLLALAFGLGGCAPASVKPAPQPVVLGVTREPFVEWGATGVNALVALGNDGGSGAALVRVTLRYAGQSWAHERFVTLGAGERRALPVRFPEPAFAARIGALALRAVGAAAVTAVSGPAAWAVGAALAGQVGLSGADALAGVLDLNVSAVVIAPGAAAIRPPGGSFTGLSLSDLTGPEAGAGVLVTGARANSPAAWAGLQARERNVFGIVTRFGDVISALDGRPVASPAGFNLLLADRRPGDVLRLTLRRDGREVSVTLVTSSGAEYGG